MLELIHRAITEEDRPEPLFKLALGLVGDLAETFQNGEIRDLLLEEWIINTLKSKTRGMSPESKRTLKWAKEVRRVSVLVTSSSTKTTFIDGPTRHRRLRILDSHALPDFHPSNLSFLCPPILRPYIHFAFFLNYRFIPPTLMSITCPHDSIHHHKQFTASSQGCPILFSSFRYTLVFLPPFCHRTTLRNCLASSFHLVNAPLPSPFRKNEPNSRKTFLRFHSNLHPFMLHCINDFEQPMSHYPECSPYSYRTEYVDAELITEGRGLCLVWE